jgi:hypothetical protein
MISFVCHLLGLSLPGIWLGHRLRLPLLWTLGGSFLIFEASLVLGAGLLSWAGLLGNQRAYQVATTLGAFGLALGLWFISRSDGPSTDDTPAEEGNPPRRLLPISSMASGAVLATLVLWFVLDWMSSWVGVAVYQKVYKLTTMLVAFGIVGLTTFVVWKTSSTSTKRRSTTFKSLSRESPLASTSIAIFAIFAALMLWLALNSYPTVEDSLTIKLQKIVFAIETNSFLPTDLTDDGRMFMSPAYPALLQLFFVINEQKSHALLVFGFANWVLCGLAIYGICRYCGASKPSSWIASALVLLSPTLIIQGTSEGDDILAATPFLLSLLFFLTWASSGRRLDALLAGLGLGLSVGVKLFPLFYLPAIPVILLFAVDKYRIPFLIDWVRARAATGFLILASFTAVLLPHAIANLVAYGNLFYVSASVLVTRNSPFTLDCAVRNTTGYMKQFLFSDLLRPVARIMVSPFASARDGYVSNIDKYNDFFSKAVPFDPTPVCSAWDQFLVTNWYPSDNTFWFGVFGPLLLFSCIAVMAIRGQTLAIRSLGLGFLVWVFAFAFTQKYIGWIGRYWSLPVLAASPIVAVILDRLIQRAPDKRASLLFITPGVVMTLALGLGVLTANSHRSLGQALRSGPRHDLFPVELRTILSKASSLNVQVIYGMDTYDYYLMLSPGAKILNKSTILGNSLNVALVRPYGISNNPFADARIAVQMNKPFAHGFRYFGQVPMGLGFVNNTEMVEDNGIDPRSKFLLFQTIVKKEGSSINGVIFQIADPGVMNNVQYRIGWRDRAGDAFVEGPWKRGLFADFKAPADAATLVIQAAFIDAEDSVSVTEWPVTASAPDILAEFK